MEFMIMAMEDTADFAARDDPERTGQYWSAWSGYIAALTESGVLKSAGGLQPPHTATTATVRDGKRTVHDGPFADSKEQLGGYFVIDVADLDLAMQWAAACPAVETGSVEVRPLIAM